MLAGVVLAWFLYLKRPDLPERISNSAKGLYTLLVNKYYFDHLYTGVIAGGISGPVARASYWFNQYVIDGVVNGAGRSAAAAGRFAYDVFDQEVVDGAFNDLARETGVVGGEARKVQSGVVQRYALLLLAGVGLIGLAVYLINVL